MRRFRRWWRRAKKTGCLGPVCWRQAEKGSYCSRDSLWGREAFPAAVAAHGGGKEAGGLWWWLLGLHGQPLEAVVAAHKEEKGEEKERGEKKGE